MPISEEEKSRIVEEEEVRCRVRRKYEQKSSGLAAVLSAVCPGLGQVYNGQIVKGGLLFLLVLAGLTLLVFGTIFLVKPAAAVNIAATVSSANQPAVQTNSEGLVASEMAKTETQLQAENNAPSPAEKKAAKGLVLTIVGLLCMIGGDYVAVRDAVKVAVRKNAG